MLDVILILILNLPTNFTMVHNGYVFTAWNKEVQTCSFRSNFLPYASSIRAQYGLMPIPFCLDSCSPRRRIFSSPFRATWTIFESITVRRSQRGLVQPSATKYLYNSRKTEQGGGRKEGLKIQHIYSDMPVCHYWSLLFLKKWLKQTNKHVKHSTTQR